MTTIPIVAHSHPFVVGVDTHAGKHVYATTGELVDTWEFPTTGPGINHAIAWVARRTGADLSALWVIEDSASYGAILAGSAAAEGYPVVEATRMDALAHRGVGKSDELDAQKIARAVVPPESKQSRRPRQDDGVRAALRVLVSARDSMTNERTRDVNALTALVRVHELGMDARKTLTDAQITEVSCWRARNEELALSVARAEAVCPARAPERVLNALSMPAVEALIRAPGQQTRHGLRDTLLILLLFDTAARIQEILDLHPADIVTTAGRSAVTLTGKGRKTRTVPIMDKTGRHVEQYLRMFHPVPTEPGASLFYTVWAGERHQMSQDNVAYMLDKYAAIGRVQCTEVPEHVNAHQLRHARACDPAATCRGAFAAYQGIPWSCEHFHNRNLCLG